LFVFCGQSFLNWHSKVLASSYTIVSPTASDFCHGPVSMALGEPGTAEAKMLKV
jgi:hypothetical protein